MGFCMGKAACLHRSAHSGTFSEPSRSQHPAPVPLRSTQRSSRSGPAVLLAPALLPGRERIQHIRRSLHSTRSGPQEPKSRARRRRRRRRRRRHLWLFAMTVGPAAPPEADADLASAPTFRRLLSFDIEDGVGGLSLADTAPTSAGTAAPAPAAAAPAAPAAPSPHGYDVLVRVVRATELPAADWWNRRADPYVIVKLVDAAGAPLLQYR